MCTRMRPAGWLLALSASAAALPSGPTTFEFAPPGSVRQYCFTACNSTSGPCPGFCGAGRACCLNGLFELGCPEHGGCADYHCCVEAVPYPSPPPSPPPPFPPLPPMPPPSPPPAPPPYRLCDLEHDCDNKGACGVCLKELGRFFDVGYSLSCPLPTDLGDLHGCQWADELKTGEQCEAPFMEDPSDPAARANACGVYDGLNNCLPSPKALA